MTNATSSIAGNPFSTCHARPGAMPYLFPAGESAELLVERLAQAGWRGQIVGPHGAGKSTLLCSLQEELQRQSFDVRSITLRADGRAASVLWDSFASATGSLHHSTENHQPAFRRRPAILLLDGAEQVGWWLWQRLLWRIRRLHWGLVVTTHRDLRLPTLTQVAPTEETAQRVVSALLADRPSPIDASDVAFAFQRCSGDIREMIFALYDLHEERKRLGASLRPPSGLSSV